MSIDPATARTALLATALKRRIGSAAEILTGLHVRVPEVRATNEIFAYYGVRRSQYGVLRPQIAVTHLFPDAPECLLIVEYDDVHRHEPDDVQRHDAAQTELYEALGHVVVRLRESPLYILNDACVGVAPVRTQMDADLAVCALA